MNRASIADARFNWHGCERRDFNRAASQSFNIKPQQRLHRFERYAHVTGAQSVLYAGAPLQQPFAIHSINAPAQVDGVRPPAAVERLELGACAPRQREAPGPLTHADPPLRIPRVVRWIT